jgi:hypothetical protein
MKSSLLLLFVLCARAAETQSSGTFTGTGSMTTARAGHSATLLRDGKVLIAGGWLTTESLRPMYPDVSALASAELYDPSSGTFTATGSMATARFGHTATLLPDGRVLIAGGSPTFGSRVALTNSEIYNPSTGTFTATGDATTPRQWHTATLLNNGKVLITGGLSGSSDAQSNIYPQDRIHLASAELYDPSIGIFTATGDMSTSRYYHTSTLLPNGRVLIEGGFDASGSAEIYDPGAGAFSLTPSAPDANLSATANLLTNGNVFFTLWGYEDCEADFSCNAGNEAELYDSSSGVFLVGNKMAAVRGSRTATLLPDGTVLIAGGGDVPLGNLISSPDRQSGAELYNPATSTFAVTGHMANGRENHTATLLRDGTVLVAGGAAWTSPFYSFGAYPTLASAELYHPAALVPAPVLLALSQDGKGQGAIQHAETYQLVTADNPAVAGEILAIYCTGLIDGSVIPPQVAIGGRMAEVLWFGNTPGYAGLNQINVRVPDGVAAGPAVPVRMNYIGRPSNEVTIGVKQ